MIRVAVVDDNPKDRKTLKNCFAKITEELGQQFTVIEFESGDAFLAGFDRSYDIICLDIDMPGKNGIDTAAAVRRLDQDVLILFVTNLAQMAIRGYEVQAYDFLIKPINEYSFAMKIKNAVRTFGRRRCTTIVIPNAGGLEAFSTGELLYAEVQGHYIYYHTKMGTLRQKGTLKELERKLEGLSFSKCNQCYLVNLDYVSSIRGDEVKVGLDWLRISRSRKKVFLEELSNYLGGLK